MFHRLSSLFLMLLFSAVSIKAQVPNGNFENWNSRSQFVPDNWHTLGAATRSTDAFEGTYSIHLENDADRDVFGVVSNTPDVSLQSGGHPYSEMPQSFRFRAKYSFSTGDAGMVACIFKLKGDIVGIANLSLQGNTADTFSQFSVPVQWLFGVAPDTVLIVLSTIDFLEGEEPLGEGYMTVDNLQFFSVGNTHPPIVNGSFETWTERFSYSPEGWLTVDDIFLEAMGGIFPFKLVERIEDSYEGNYAVRMQNFYSEEDDEITPGAMLTTKSLDEVEEPAFPVTQKWGFLNGWYRYAPSDGDEPQIMLVMFKNGSPIGTLVNSKIKPSNVWSPFSIAIGYFSSETPDSAFIILSASNVDDPIGKSSVLFIDKLELSNQMLSIPQAYVYEPIRTYPNPVNDELSLDFDRFAETHAYSITDLLGRSVEHGILQYASINTAHLIPGTYFLQIHSNTHIYHSKFIKK